MATIREVAERAGVSVATVSHVINETRPVSVELRERVREAMSTLQYRPNRLARSLRRGETCQTSTSPFSPNSPGTSRISPLTEATA